ncbi:MAG: HAMP domain-containing protein [Rhodopseudomonas palustris]|nr:MAG: HAMP domain-containing protein [Rhodopseudomonas palustris]
MSARTVRLPKLTIARRIYLLIAVGFTGLLANVVLDSRELGSALKHQKQMELQHLGEIAVAIAKDEFTGSQKGDLSAADAQKRALARIAALRYGNNDYFFVNDMNNVTLMNPMAPQLNGKNMAALKDPTGKAFIAEMTALVQRSGSGFVDYQWTKPGASAPSPKLSHVVGFAPWGWVIGTGVYIDDLDAQLAVSTQHSLLVVAAVTLLTLLISTLVARSITKPLHRVTSTMKVIAEGRIDTEVPGIGRSDEIGEIASAVEVFKNNAAARQRLEAEQHEQEARSAAQRRADTMKLASDFDSAIGRIIEAVSSAASELEGSATTLTSTAARSQDRATVVAGASEEASSNVQSVASATEEMTSSVQEISRQVQDSARIANEAVEQARQTNSSVSELAGAASRIGDVVELINTIAGQTNLLALNATIEAARAGEAGRGFAVVANEVKALAEQTAKATDEISQQIAGIQAATRQSVSAIRGIGETITRMSDISSTIASAVEQQGAATREISRNVQQAAHGTREVSINIVEVQRNATETGSASAHVLTAARSLSQDSRRLKDEVSRFLDTVRAA